MYVAAVPYNGLHNENYLGLKTGPKPFKKARKSDGKNHYHVSLQSFAEGIKVTLYLLVLRREHGNLLHRDYMGIAYPLIPY